MKRIGAWCLIFLLAFAAVPTVRAETTSAAPFQTMADLYASWDEWPDYVCGVWTETGGMDCLTIGIQNNADGEAGKQEILDLIADDSTVTFVYQAYTDEYLRRVSDDISDAYLGGEAGVIGVGVYSSKNCVGVTILEDKRDEAVTKALVAALAAEYGDAVSIDYSGPVVADVKKGIRVLPTTALLAVPLLAAVVLFGLLWMKRRRAMLLQTVGGDTKTVTAPLSTAEVKRRVSKGVTPSAALDERVREAIEQTDK